MLFGNDFTADWRGDVACARYPRDRSQIPSFSPLAIAIKCALVIFHRAILTPIKDLTRVTTPLGAPNDAANNPRAKEILSSYAYVHWLQSIWRRRMKLRAARADRPLHPGATSLRGLRDFDLHRLHWDSVRGLSFALAVIRRLLGSVVARDCSCCKKKFFY